MYDVSIKCTFHDVFVCGFFFLKYLLRGEGGAKDLFIIHLLIIRMSTALTPKGWERYFCPSNHLYPIILTCVFALWFYDLGDVDSWIFVWKPKLCKDTICTTHICIKKLPNLFDKLLNWDKSYEMLLGSSCDDCGSPISKIWTSRTFAYGIQTKHVLVWWTWLVVDNKTLLTIPIWW